jgi:hypothetical protein
MILHVLYLQYYIPGLESINVTLRESIRDPNGRIVNTNEFSKDFFTTFKPNMTGEYTLLISNLGPNDVNIDRIFGSYHLLEEITKLISVR